MKAFVTGATGFLGRNLVEQLVEKNWQVVAMHRDGSDISDLEHLDIELVEASFLDVNSLRNAVPEQCDAVFHLAGDTNLWSHNNQAQYDMNVTATQHLLTVAREKNIGRFIHTSSISAFGFHDSTITEATQSFAMISGVNYLKTKFLGEHEVKSAVDNGLDAVILNPCAIIGPYDKHNWSQLFTMVNDGTLPGVPPGKGSYCHVREVAAAHIAAFEKGRTGENYILAGVDCSFLQVVTLIGQLLGKTTPKKAVPSWVLYLLGIFGSLKSKITKTEPNMTIEKAKMVSKRVIAKSDKAVNELGYKADVSIDEMLTDCFKWMKDTNRL